MYILVLLSLTAGDRMHLSLPNVYIAIAASKLNSSGSETFGTWSGSEGGVFMSGTSDTPG